MKGYGPVVGAFVLGALCVAGGLSPFLHKHFTLHALARDVDRLFRRADYIFDRSETPIECWGDSLTEGNHLTPGHDYPHLISYVFRRNAINRGVSGETSLQTKNRMLSRNVPVFPEKAIIWTGRNDDFMNADETERNIDEMVRSLRPYSKFLVLGILNSDTFRERKGGDRYRIIVKVNDDLKNRYGERFVPIRDILIAHGNKNDEDDEYDAEADVVPSSLRLDALHLNDQGEAVVAYAVEAAIIANRW